MTVLSFPNCATASALHHAFDIGAIEPQAQDYPTPRLLTLEQARALLVEAHALIARQEERIRKLEKTALIDEPTGLANKRGLMGELRRALAAARRGKKNAGLLLLVDLDDFPSVADAYGSAAQERYAQTMAAVLIDEVRIGDVVAHIANGTFGVFMMHTTAKAAADRLFTLEKRIETRVMHLRDASVPLRASIGMAVIEEKETPESLMIAADLSLYAARSRKKGACRKERSA